MKSKTLKYISCFFGLIFVFVSLMTLVYAIPNSMLIERQENAMSIMNAEGNYPKYFFGTPAAQLDNYTDKLMLDKAIIDDETMNPLEAAMDIDGYASYWHGYQIFLRPLLTVFSYYQIRYIYMFIFFILLCITFSVMHKKAGLPTALAFLAAMISLYIILVAVSLQFISVFIIMFIACLYLLNSSQKSDIFHITLTFMIIGMTTSFFDLLTAPLLTWGIPLLLCLFLKMQHSGKESWLEYVKTAFWCSVSWVSGYGLCWLSKWVISSVVLKENIMKEALDSILFRTMGDEEYSINRPETIKDNFEYLFKSQGNRIFIFWIAAIIILAILLFFFHKAESKRLMGHAWLFLPISLFPYVWYFVLSNHSGIHSWFTYRIQAITIFGIFLFFIYLIDWKKCKSFFFTCFGRGKKCNEGIASKK